MRFKSMNLNLKIPKNISQEENVFMKGCWRDANISRVVRTSDYPDLRIARKHRLRASFRKNDGTLL